MEPLPTGRNLVRNPQSAIFFALVLSLAPWFFCRSGETEKIGSQYVVDFSPIDTFRKPIDCKIVIIIHTIDGKAFRAGSSTSGGVSKDLASDLLSGFKGQFVGAEFEVRKLNKTQLLIIGKHGKLVEKIAVEVQGLANQFHPVARKAQAKDLVPPPPHEAFANIDFHDVQLAEAPVGTRFHLILEPSEGGSSDSSIPLGNKQTARELLDTAYDLLLSSDWNIRRDGNRLTILSNDGNNGRMPLKRIQIFAVGNVPQSCLPTIVATANVKVERGK